MKKRLVICCDGTWDNPNEMIKGEPCPTNVTKLALAVAGSDAEGVRQEVYYHTGVGTRRGERIRGGLVGYGLSRDVLSAYRFIVDNYTPDDELFFFGFSRGAYTARSAAGMVRNVGVLRRENIERIDDAYQLYRDEKRQPNHIDSMLFRKSYSHASRIRFIGVWDTVGALGIPMSPNPLVNLINRRWAFHDVQLSGTVDAAFHALAIDEKRPPFRPTLWTQSPKATGQRVEQVWFTGVHRDVGGGCHDGSLADITLMWMVERAHEYGLALDENAFTEAGGWGKPGTGLPAVRPNSDGPVNESRTGIWKLLRPLHREIGDPAFPHQFVSSTAFARYNGRADIASPMLMSYLAGKPQVMPIDATIPRQAEKGAQTVAADSGQGATASPGGIHRNAYSK